jgi:hypothetical protein
VKKLIIQRGVYGIAGANIISPIIALIIHNFDSSFNSITIFQYFRFTLSVSFIGFVFSSSSVLFQIESISRSKATALHFLFLASSYFLAGEFAGWISYDWRILITILSFISSYLISYISIVISMSIYAKKINEALRRG